MRPGPHGALGREPALWVVGVLEQFLVGRELALAAHLDLRPDRPAVELLEIAMTHVFAEAGGLLAEDRRRAAAKTWLRQIDSADPIPHARDSLPGGTHDGIVGWWRFEVRQRADATTTARLRRSPVPPLDHAALQDASEALPTSFLGWVESRVTPAMRDPVRNSARRWVVAWAAAAQAGRLD